MSFKGILFSIIRVFHVARPVMLSSENLHLLFCSIKEYYYRQSRHFIPGRGAKRVLYLTPSDRFTRSLSTPHATGLWRSSSLLHNPSNLKQSMRASYHNLRRTCVPVCVRTYVHLAYTRHNSKHSKTYDTISDKTRARSALSLKIYRLCFYLRCNKYRIPV